MFDNGAGTNVLATTAQLLGNEVRVTLRRTSGGGIQATAAEVAAAINAANLPVWRGTRATATGWLQRRARSASGTLTQGFDASL
jgi:hypothetical protein